MADQALQEILAHLKREQTTASHKTTPTEMRSIASDIQKAVTAALREGTVGLGASIAKQAGIPMRQLASGESASIGQQFAPVLQKWFQEFDEVGKSTKKLKEKFNELGGILDDVRKKHEKEITQRQQITQAQQGGAGFGQGIVGMLGSAAHGDIRGFMASASAAISGGKGLGELVAGLGAGGIAKVAPKLGLWGLAAAGAAETALLSMGVNRLQQAWPEASQNARAASRARMGMGLGMGGPDILGPFNDQAGQFAVMPGQIAGNISSFMGAGGSGVMGGRGLGGMLKVSEVMERISNRYGVSADEMSRTMGEMNRWALQTPDGLYKSIDKAYKTAQKTGQTEMFPEMLRAVASTVGFVNPRTFGPMGGNTDKITSILGDLARYGYRGAAGSQVYGQIAGAVGGMMFDPMKAAFGYGVLGLSMQQMVDPNSPETVEQVIKGFKGDRFKRMFPGMMGQVAPRLMGFGDMSGYALNRMAAGQEVAWEKAMGPGGTTQESLSKMAEGMLSEQFFTTDQALTRTKIDETNKVLSTGGMNVMNALNSANRLLLMMTLGQFAGKDNMFEQIGKMLGLDKFQIQSMQGAMGDAANQAFPKFIGPSQERVAVTNSTSIIIDGNLVGRTTVTSGGEMSGQTFNKRPGGGQLSTARYAPPKIVAPPGRSTFEATAR